MIPELLVAHGDPAARGFPPSQVIPATIVTLLGTAQVLALAVRYRRGHLPWLDRLAARAGRGNGLPGYAALPAKIASVSLLTAGFGFYWDVAWHIDRGRDDGPFSTPAHYPIVFGLAGIALAGLVSVVLDRDPEAPVRLPFGLRSSVGGALVLLCGVVALGGFPLDDIWHTLFGQDVTLWSPTHIQMVGGASLSTLALWMLVEEGRRRPGSAAAVSRRTPADAHHAWHVRLRAFFLRSDVRIAGSVLIGLSTLQGEYDFGVPQFPPLCQPVLIALAASITLVAARIKIGRGGAVGAVVVFLVIRGAMALLIGPVLGRSFLHMPLYLGEALLVEAVALWCSTRRQLTFGALSGLAVGTFGLLSEWGWTQVAMPLPWHGVLIPDALLLGAFAGTAGGVLGGLVGRALSAQPLPRQRTPRGVAAAAMASALAVLAVVVPIRTHHGWSAELTLDEATPAPSRSVWVTAHLSDEAARTAEDPAWLHVLAWQGGDGTWSSDVLGQEIVSMRETAPGVWRSTRPVPVSGKWKSFLRLATPTTLQSVPIYLPADTAIPAAEIPAPAQVTRAFVTDHQLLQREAVGGSDAVKAAAYIGLGVVGLMWVLCIAVGARRLERVLPVAEPSRPRRREHTS
jgi:hypothetical protein